MVSSTAGNLAPVGNLPRFIYLRVELLCSTLTLHMICALERLELHIKDACKLLVYGECFVNFLILIICVVFSIIHQRDDVELGVAKAHQISAVSIELKGTP